MTIMACLRLFQSIDFDQKMTSGKINLTFNDKKNSQLEVPESEERKDE